MWRATTNMSIFLTIQIAVRALSRNKMRATLTVLGVVIGIAAVTTVVSIGNSAGQLIQSQIESFGTNFMFVGGKEERRGRRARVVMPRLTEADCFAIDQECPAVLATSPMVFAPGKPAAFGNSTMDVGSIMGTGISFPIIRSWTVQAGGFFTTSHVESAARVCVIGYTVVSKLFQTRNPIGETLRIGGVPFEVIGVLEKKGGGMGGDDTDSAIVMPYTTVRQRLSGSKFSDVHAIFVAAKSPEKVTAATNQMDMLLRERHKIGKGDEPDFEIHSANEISSMMGNVMGIITAALSGIAGISLLVGGVGIMNIMLVSVTERTREIGVRMAVGAKSTDILVQFLIEAVVLSCFGGVIGISMGAGASFLASHVINAVNSDMNWPVVFSPTAGAVAIVFAALVGIVFGMYPAWRASRLDPIDALRYE